MTDICKCGHREDEHLEEDPICIAIKNGRLCECEIYTPDRTTERMADVVSAAVRWREIMDEPVSKTCDCNSCTLIRAVDNYMRKENCE